MPISRSCAKLYAKHLADTALQKESLLGTVLPAVGTLLGASAAAKKKTVIQRTPVMHPTSHPTVRQDRRDHVEPPRPLQPQPHNHHSMNAPRKPSAPGGQNRPGPNRPGGHHGPGGRGRR